MENKPDKSDADRFNAEVVRLKAKGWDAHRDSRGWYLVLPSEKEPKDGTSLGSDGRKHYPEEKDVWQPLVSPYMSLLLGQYYWQCRLPLMRQEGHGKTSMTLVGVIAFRQMN